MCQQLTCRFFFEAIPIGHRIASGEIPGKSRRSYRTYQKRILREKNHPHHLFRCQYDIIILAGGFCSRPRNPLKGAGINPGASPRCTLACSAAGWLHFGVVENFQGPPKLK